MEQGEPEAGEKVSAEMLGTTNTRGRHIAITGVAGPGPDQDKPAGLVHIATARGGRSREATECRFEGKPKEVLASAIRKALEFGIAALDR